MHEPSSDALAAHVAATDLLLVKLEAIADASPPEIACDLREAIAAYVRTYRSFRDQLPDALVNPILGNPVSGGPEPGPATNALVNPILVHPGPGSGPPPEPPGN